MRSMRRRYGAIRFRQLRRIVFQDRAHGVGGGLPSERTLAGKHLVKNGAETENIAAMIGFLAAHLFRRHVAYGTEHHAGTGGTTGWSKRLLIADAMLDQLCQAEVQDLHATIFGNKDVLGLQVAMNDVLVMCGSQTACDLRRILNSFSLREAAQSGDDRAVFRPQATR